MKKIVFFLLEISWLFIFCRPALAQTSSQVFNPRILYVVINPVEGANNLWETYLQGMLNGKTADQFTDYWANQWVSAFKRLSNNTINYQIARKLQVTTFPRHTQGIEYTLDSYNQDCIVHGGARSACEAHARDIDYPAFINDNRICEIAAQENIDEIWVIEPYALQNGEDYIIGPSYGPWTNGPAFAISSCQKYYNITVANATCAANFMESYGHRIEANLRYLSKNWRGEDFQKYIDNFTVFGRYGDHPYDKIYCGNAHYPHNAVMGYDFANRTYKDSSCIDWKNFPNFTGTTQNINCEAWGCTGQGWQEFWLGSLPRSNGWTELTGNNGQKIYFKNNWWYYLLYPENAIAFRNNLPFPPEKLSVSYTGGAAILSWDRVPGATKYALRIDDLTDGWDGSCSSPAGDLCNNNVTSTSFTFILNPNHHYRWWIHAVNDLGQSSPSYGPNFPVACNTTCTNNSQCPTEYCFAPGTTPGLCRNRSCETETDCVCPRQCNYQCTSSGQCQKTNLKYVCVQRTNSQTSVCRNIDCLDDVSCCQVPTPTPISPDGNPPNCPKRILGNLSCDSQGLINETDLEILLKNYDQANLPTLETLLQNWISK